MYDPLKYHGVKEGTCVAIVGCGGLGQMGIKLVCVCVCVVHKYTHACTHELETARFNSEPKRYKSVSLSAKRP